MGYVKTDLYKLPSDSAYWVRMKQTMPTGDWMAAMDYWRAYELPPEGAKDSPEARARDLAEQKRELEAARLVISRAVIDWNLTNADDELLPVEPESLLVLTREDFAFLRGRAELLMAGRPVEAEAPFANGSGKRSRATTSKRRPS